MNKITCSLGLRNAKGQGGSYKGRGIASIVRHIRHQLERDGLVSKKKNEGPEPHIAFNYSQAHLQSLQEENGVAIKQMMENDSDFQEICCAGFGKDKSPHRSRKCDGCPYRIQGAGGPLINMPLRNFFKKEGLQHASQVLFEIAHAKKKHTQTVEDFISLTEAEVLSIQSVGPHTVEHYKKALAKYGLHFKSEHSTKGEL
jgi:hypothetical protein